MIKFYNAKYYCCEDISLIENYEQAIKDETQTWDCHHRLEIDENKTVQQLVDEGRYFNRPASELIFMTQAEHKKIHALYTPKEINMKKGWSRGKHLSEEHKKNISISGKGKHYRKLTDEQKLKISNTLKGHIGANVGKHRVYDNDEKTKFHMEY